MGSIDPPGGLTQPTSSSQSPNPMPGSDVGGGNWDGSRHVDVLSHLDMESANLADWRLETSDSNRAQRTEQVVAQGRYAYQLRAGSNYNDAAFLRWQPKQILQPNVLYVQFLFRMEQPQNDGHTTFALIAGQQARSQVRMGGQFGMLVANLESTDGQRISADSFNQFPHPVILATNQWYCVQLLFDGEQQHYRTWLNDREVENLRIASKQDWTSPPSDDRWIPPITELKLGWQSYGAGNGNTVYLDDILVAQSRLQCPSLP